MTGADRPETAHEALRDLAGWLDEADRLIDALAEARHLPRSNSGDGVQRDLRALADWFEGHPGAAAEAWAHVQTVVPVTPPASAVAAYRATQDGGADEAVLDRAEVHYAGMQAVREMPSDWYCPRSEPGRSRRDCPECVAEVALDAALDAALTPQADR